LITKEDLTGGKAGSLCKKKSKRSRSIRISVIVNILLFIVIVTFDQLNPFFQNKASSLPPTTEGEIWWFVS